MPSGASPRATIINATRTLGVIASFGAAACHAPSFSRAALAYLPTGTSRTSPVTIEPSPASLARSKFGPIATLSSLESFGAISTSWLPSKLNRVSSLMSFLFEPKSIHFEVGGGEYVGHRSLRNLLYKCRTRRVARNHLDIGALSECGVYVVERVLH